MSMEHCIWKEVHNVQCWIFWTCFSTDVVWNLGWPICQSTVLCDQQNLSSVDNIEHIWSIVKQTLHSFVYLVCYQINQENSQSRIRKHHVCRKVCIRFYHEQYPSPNPSNVLLKRHYRLPIAGGRRRNVDEASPGGLQTAGDQLQGNGSSRQKSLEIQENYH